MSAHVCTYQLHLTAASSATVENRSSSLAERQKNGDAGDAVSANVSSCPIFLGLHAIFCTIFKCMQFFACFAHFLHAFLVLIFQTQSFVSAIFQTSYCNGRKIKIAKSH